jgi:hypothetical protein
MSKSMPCTTEFADAPEPYETRKSRTDNSGVVDGVFI